MFLEALGLDGITKDYILTGFVQVFAAMVFLTLAMTANILFRLFYNIKIQQKKFDKSLFWSGILKLLTVILGTTLLTTVVIFIPYFIMKVGIQLPEELLRYITATGVILIFFKPTITYIRYDMESLHNIIENIGGSINKINEGLAPPNEIPDDEKEHWNDLLNQIKIIDPRFEKISLDTLNKVENSSTTIEHEYYNSNNQVSFSNSGTLQDNLLMTETGIHNIRTSNINNNSNQLENISLDNGDLVKTEDSNLYNIDYNNDSLSDTESILEVPDTTLDNNLDESLPPKRKYIKKNKTDNTTDNNESTSISSPI